MEGAGRRIFVSRGVLVAAVAILLAAAYLRFHALDRKSLWMDELRQVGYYRSSSVAEVVSKAASQQQPPLDYLIGYGLYWAGLDLSDWWVRFPAAVFGVLGVLCIVILGVGAAGPAVGLLAGFLAALSPLHIAMSQEARPYTIFTFLLLLTLLLFVRARVRPRAANWFWFGLALLLCLLARAIEPVVLSGVLVLYVLGRLVIPLERRPERAVTAAADSTVRVWDLETGKCVRALEGHTDAVTRVALTADGRRAVSGSRDGTVRLWDLDTGECLRVLPGHASGVTDFSLPSRRSWIETREIPRFWPALCAILIPLALTLRLDMMLTEKGQAYVRGGFSPWQSLHEAVRMMELAFDSAVGPLHAWVFLFLAFGVAFMAWQSFGGKRQANADSREYALVVLVILPAICLLYSYLHVTLTSVGVAAKYLLCEIAPVSIISAAGFVGVLSLLWRRFRPAAVVALLVGLGAFALGTEPAVRSVYSMEGKFDYRGLWREMAPFLGDDDAVVVVNTTGILPGTWHPPLHGQDRYAPAFRGPNWHAKDVTEKPDLLDAVHGKVVLVGFRDYRGGHMEPPRDLPPEVGLIERVNLWAIWFKHPSGSAEEQLADLLELGLTGVRPANGAVYPFLLRAVLLARAGDQPGAAAALQQAYWQCGTEAERKALATVSATLLTGAVLQLREERWTGDKGGASAERGVAAPPHLQVTRLGAVSAWGWHDRTRPRGAGHV
jgi:hypothetical protein